ncbi:hypothetical protein [Novosphingobium sp. KN65.2]|uniref:hypothetical protein n=1 Tax=Novosphingobium sp. KN65.2 TaxID=1478134 RepID=UPI0005DC8B65|nr:hypothetical protein [Novosphingobium sp. KN65.2]CDO37808.1 hypothetical protein SPHV1_410025 [Novosphingobium sp. KN65.2]
MKNAADSLVENIDMRDGVPPGWRRLYDRLIVDLYRLDCAAEVTAAGAHRGELAVTLASHAAVPAGVERLIDAARRASAALCEECGAVASLHDGNGTVRSLCGPHYRLELAVQAATERLFEGERAEALRWVDAFAVALGEAPGERAMRSQQGFEEVLALIRRIESGVYC